MNTSNHTKKKVPIMTTAMAVMGTGTTLMSNGHYVEGGLLSIAGIGCIVAYEAFQVRELPEPVTDDMITQSVEWVSDEIKQNTTDDESSTNDSETDVQKPQTEGNVDEVSDEKMDISDAEL